MTVICTDCGMVDPPDDHTCQQYDSRIAAERARMTIEEKLNEMEHRLNEIERRLAQHTADLLGRKPWIM